MSRYIDADALIVNMRGAFIDHIEEFRAITIIKDAPSIDIVRCKDCKYYEAKEDWCYWRDEAITADDFCSYGESSSSEKPNNYCDDCLYTDTCDSKEFFYACTSKATISKMEQVEDEPQRLKGGKDVHEFCKGCDKSKARMFEGERFIVCGEASEIPCICMRECPLGRWIADDTYLIKPKDEPQTDCAWK